MAVGDPAFPPWFVDVVAEANTVWKDEALAYDFLNGRHPLLGGRRPADVARESEEGAAAVLRILGRLLHGTAA